MKLDDAIIAWNPRQGHKRHEPWVRVGPHPDTTGWSGPYAFMEGACFHEHWPEVDEMTRLASLFQLFITLVVRDGVPVEHVHREFSAIDEYRENLSEDTPAPLIGAAVW